MESQVHFVNDKEEGIAKFWSENGKLSIVKMFHLGVEFGATTEYYENYKVKGQYINGKEEGEWRYIDSLGKVTRIDIYKNGVKRK